jgi:hypothetical protein
MEDDRCGAIIGQAGTGFKAVKEGSGTSFTIERGSAYAGARLTTIVSNCSGFGALALTYFAISRLLANVTTLI